MTNPQLAGLTAEERALYGIHSTAKPDKSDPGMNDILRSLARSRALPKKLEWCILKTDIEGYVGRYCPRCDRWEEQGHTKTCAIAAELAGTDTEVRNNEC